MPRVVLRTCGELSVRLPRLVGGAELLMALGRRVDCGRRVGVADGLDHLLVAAGLVHLPHFGRILRRGEARQQEERNSNSSH